MDLTNLDVVKGVFAQHITAEIALRQSELECIDQRLLACRVQLHQLRLAILAQEHGLERSDSVGCRQPWHSVEVKAFDSRFETWKELELQFLAAEGTAEDDLSNVFSSFKSETTSVVEKSSWSSPTTNSECSDSRPVFEGSALDWNDDAVDDVLRDESMAESGHNQLIPNGNQSGKDMLFAGNLNECHGDKPPSQADDGEDCKVSLLARDSAEGCDAPVLTGNSDLINDGKSIV